MTSLIKELLTEKDVRTSEIRPHHNNGAKACWNVATGAIQVDRDVQPFGTSKMVLALPKCLAFQILPYSDRPVHIRIGMTSV